ncbi:MAG: hypothetical protein AAB368_09005, partial [bacterium]
MNNRGMVLGVVLWAVALFEVLVVGVLYAARLDLRRGQYRLDRVRALALAQGGVERVAALLAQDQNSYDALNEAWSLGPTRRVEFPAEGRLTVSVEDEEGKVHLNSVS